MANSFYAIAMVRVFIVASLLGSSLAAALSWSQTQNLTVYKNATIALADSLPEVAIPKLESLMAREDLDKTTLLNLRALLGESFVRANQPNKALKVLTDSGPKSNTWKAHALSQLGRLEEAASVLAAIKSDDATYQRALIANALGNPEKALSLVTPLAKKNTQSRALAISIYLDTGKLDDAETLLKPAKGKTPSQAPTLRYLRARLQLLRKDRLTAVGSFQALLAPNPEEHQLSSAYFHAATLGLADSLALESNEKAAAESLIDTLEKHPNSPRLREIFARLLAWRSHIDPTKLKAWTQPAPSSLLANPLHPKPQIGTSIITPLTPRNAHALHLLARIHLDAQENRKARLLLARLRMAPSENWPDLYEQSLIGTGLSLLKNEQADIALNTFALLEEHASTNRMKAIAKALKGTAAFTLQDPKQAIKAFEEAQKIAQKIGDQSLAELTSLNAGLSALLTGKSSNLKGLPPLSLELLNLERGLILADQRDSKSRPILERFRKEHPEDPRNPEAALALAESYSFATPPEPDSAKKILDRLSFDPTTQSDLSARRILALLSLGHGLDLTTQFIAKNPDHPRAPELLFQQGQALMLKQIGEAIVSFKLFLKKFPDHPLEETTLFLCARASSSMNTEEHDTRAIEYYQKIMQSKGPLATAAAIDLARLQIDRSEQEVALANIETLLKDKKLDPNDRRRLLVLAAEAASQNAHYEEALKFYEELLAQKNLPVSWFNRASFFRGRVLEDLGRQGDALRSYYQVVLNNLNPTDPDNIEWQWHYKCAFNGALPLLVKNERWEDALALALRVAQSGGPSAKQAEELARKIRFDKMIWPEKNKPSQ